MIKIARNIERYNLACRLAWKHISERQKREYTFLHDVIRRQLKEGAVEPLFIAAEALKNIEKLTGEFHNDEEPAIPIDDRNNRFRHALRFATGLRSKPR